MVKIGAATRLAAVTAARTTRRRRRPARHARCHPVLKQATATAAKQIIIGIGVTA